MANIERLPDLVLEAHYRTGNGDPVFGFYGPCLGAAARYERAVGYFRSSVFAVIGKPFLAFARRGGRARFICSPSLTEEDVQEISSGYMERQAVVDKVISREVDSLFATEGAQRHLKLLASFIKFGSLDIKVAVRKVGNGIYHEKIGIFTDSDGHRVSFLGSANETWSAWHAEGNHESIEVFRSWVDADTSRVDSHSKIFESLWAGQTPGVQTLNFPEAQRRKLLTVAAPRLDDPDLDPPDSSGSIARPSRRLLPHQAAAIDHWKRAGQRGVLEHATGSGKTITAIHAIKDHLRSGNPALVLVPSHLLLKQWREEIDTEIGGVTILLAGAGNTRWRQNGSLASHTRPGLGLNRVVIATMQTAASSEFRAALNQGDHLLLVADEVHQIGSPYNSRSMEIKSGPVLGLSATPERYGDPDGTAKIFERFGPVVEPRITLQDAIDAGRLVQYEYYPHPIYLSDEESEDWKRLTKEISFEMAKTRETGAMNGPLSERALRLLIARSRIAKKASAKPGLAVGVLQREFISGQHWLVYCEDSDQLSETTRRLNDIGLNPIEYHSGMAGDKAATLDWFKRFGGILVSIRCLDEGVDIPSVSHALILASSQNPRQFIQRRGRVLRKSGDKVFAVIHDAIVSPLSVEDDPEQVSLLRAELMRALEFANSAINHGSTTVLRKIAVDAGVDLDEIVRVHFEDDDGVSNDT